MAYKTQGGIYYSENTSPFQVLSSIMLSSSLLSLLWLLLSASTTSVLAFNFTTPLIQCSNVTIEWGAGGTPPYEILLVPIGHVTPEIRTIINYQNITSPTNSFSFPLTFPAGSQFVAVLSDSKYGPGSGGTSEILTVTGSNGTTDDAVLDSSCLATTQVKPAFYFYLDPPAPSQCEPWEISWPKTLASSSNTTTQFVDDGFSLWAIVPGQATFAVPLPSTPSTEAADPSLDCGAWNVDLATGTELLLVAGYAPGSIPHGSKSSIVNGRGKGGSTDILTVGKGSNGASCLTSDPPATTLFPATSSVPTGTTATSAAGTQTPIGATSGGTGAALSAIQTPSSMTSMFVGLFVLIGLFGLGF